MAVENNLSTLIKQQAHNLGFFACGFAKAQPVEPSVAKAYRQWVSSGSHATMGYMADNIEKRLDPRLLVDGVQSIVCLAINYAPSQRIDDDQYQIAAYAYGKDYHDVMKQRLHQLALACGLKTYRAFCDTAPVLERYWAVKAGLGWTGRHHQLIIPNAGTMFYLGELFIPEVLDYDSPIAPRCGSCHACIDACPTNALSGDSTTVDTQLSTFNSEKCLSYQTIENHGELSPDAKASMGNYIYGCDRCQTACPWNRFATPNEEPLLQPSEALLQMTKEDWDNLTPEQYRSLFKGSAVKRAKYEGLMRNIHSKE